MTVQTHTTALVFRLSQTNWGEWRVEVEAHDASDWITTIEIRKPISAWTRRGAKRRARRIFHLGTRGEYLGAHELFDFDPTGGLMETCPECGSPITKGYRPNPTDPGDVEPRADCTNPHCEWGY